jgi:LysM repeat protein
MSASSAFHDTFGRDAFGDYGRPDGGASANRQGAGKQGASGRQRTKQAPLRLTRRGRFVFIGVPLILLAALILTLSGFLNAPAKAAESAAGLSLTPTVTVTVQPGESLWAIAESVAPERDPRDVVTDIIQLNNLEAARVVPGQALFIPSK